MFRKKKSSRSFSNWGPSRPVFFLQKMSHRGSSRPHLFKKQVELEIFSRPVFRRKTCLNPRSFSNRGSCPGLASCLLPTKKTYKPHFLKSQKDFFPGEFFQKTRWAESAKRTSKQIADEGEEITLQPANASCHWKKEIAAWEFGVCPVYFTFEEHCMQF